MGLLALFLCAFLTYPASSSGCQRTENNNRPGVTTPVAIHSEWQIPQEDLDNMLNVLRVTAIVLLRGDSAHAECTRSQLDKRTREESEGFFLDFWSAVTCTLGVVSGSSPEPYAKLYCPNQSVPGVSLQTLYLPLFEHNTASFTTVPRTLDPTFFITATLTGCDVFIASAGDGSVIGCPLLAIHTNACGNMVTDVNHQEAMAVLSLDLCRTQQYQVKYRFASDLHRSVIEQGHYNYLTEYYLSEAPAVFFGYTYGGRSVTTREKWYFCAKNRYSQGMKCHTDEDF